MSDEIGASLESFIQMREQAMEIQLEALSKYEATMNELDNKTPEAIKRNAHADHNLLRHLGQSLQYAHANYAEEGAGENDYDDKEYADESFEAASIKKPDDDLPAELSQIVNTSVFAKVQTPSFEEKQKLRDVVFGFLASSVQREEELEGEVERLREDGANFRKIDDALEALYQAQVHNADTLRKAIVGYKPVQGLKAWANDPEYSSLLRMFEDVVIDKSKKKSAKKKRKAKRRAVVKKKKVTAAVNY